MTASKETSHGIGMKFGCVVYFVIIITGAGCAGKQERDAKVTQLESGDKP